MEDVNLPKAQKPKAQKSLPAAGAGWFPWRDSLAGSRVVDLPQQGRVSQSQEAATGWARGMDCSVTAPPFLLSHISLFLSRRRAGIQLFTPLSLPGATLATSVLPSFLHDALHLHELCCRLQLAVLVPWWLSWDLAAAPAVKFEPCGLRDQIQTDFYLPASSPSLWCCRIYHIPATRLCICLCWIHDVPNHPLSCLPSPALWIAAWPSSMPTAPSDCPWTCWDLTPFPFSGVSKIAKQQWLK